MTRIKTLLLSMSLLATTALPALADEGLRGGRPPAPYARQSSRPDYIQTDDDVRLEHFLAAQSAAEERYLEATLARNRVNGRDAQLQRDYLAEKQELRNAHEREWLDEKQRAVAENDRAWLANKDRIRARYERAWQAEKERTRAKYESAGLETTEREIDRQMRAHGYRKNPIW